MSTTCAGEIKPSLLADVESPTLEGLELAFLAAARTANEISCDVKTQREHNRCWHWTVFSPWLHGQVRPLTGACLRNGDRL